MQGPPPGNGPYGYGPPAHPQQPPAQGQGQAPHPGQGHPQQGHPHHPQGYPQQGHPPPQGYPQQQGHGPHALSPQHSQGYPQQGHPQHPQGSPQQGYPQGHVQPALAHQRPHGHAQPALGHPAPARTVSGVPLEPGERVIYFRKVEQWGGRIFRIVAGIALMPFLIGFFILYSVFSEMPGEPDAQAITNKRILSMKSSGKIIDELRWEQVAGFTKVLRRAAMATMAVRDAQGPKILFAEDGPWLEKALPAWLTAETRDQSPEVPFV